MSKLVRDKIPDIIRASGETPVTHKVTGYKLIQALAAKLYEEVDEFALATTDEERIEELADIKEVVNALAQQFTTLSGLEEIRLLKRVEKGGFSEGIIWQGNE